MKIKHNYKEGFPQVESWDKNILNKYKMELPITNEIQHFLYFLPKSLFKWLHFSVLVTTRKIGKTGMISPLA